MINEFYVCDAYVLKTGSTNYELWGGSDSQSFVIIKSDDLRKIITYCFNNKIHIKYFSVLD